ncbi:MAG: sugar phosphate isomerase/epimerase [Ruminococcaceae bacterium]|nr:sugar phosphate isomerase/epimerase [Oscillospiraceae bacterium]
MDQRIGAQMYTVTSFCQTEKDFEESLSKLSKIGYQVVQLSGISWDIPATRIKELCDQYGMTVACTHMPMNFYEEKMDWVIDYHKTIGAKVAGLGWLGAEYRSDIDNVKQGIEKMNGFDRQLREAGLRFGYHNHAFEFKKLDGKYILDYMIELGTFDFILDTYWVAYSGINPATLIESLGERASMIHFKDLQVLENNTVTFTEIGQGNLDWDAIIKASQKAKFALVEEDKCPADPFDSLKISYEYLTKKGFC